MNTQQASWPPPPDLESIRELVRNADVEGFIAIHGAPPDEYDTEAEAFHSTIRNLPTENITAASMLPLLEAIWRNNFINDEAELALRRPALQALAAQVARFFGSEAKPQVRPSS